LQAQSRSWSKVEYPGSLYVRELDDGRVITVYRMLFTTRLCIGPDDGVSVDDGWCYSLQEAAIDAARAWDGDGDPPLGWHRQISTGRRRPGGNPALEYINP
jgi:hypothetical protein